MSSPGFFFAASIEVGHAFPRTVRRHDDEEIGAEQRGHGLEVLHRVVRDLLVHMGLQRHVRVVHLHQRVTVGGRFLRRLDRDEAVRAGPVLDEDRLAPALRQLLADDAQHRVGPASRRKRRDDPDRLRGKGLARRRWGAAINATAATTARKRIACIGIPPPNRRDGIGRYSAPLPAAAGVAALRIHAKAHQRLARHRPQSGSFRQRVEPRLAAHRRVDVREVAVEHRVLVLVVRTVRERRRRRAGSRP